MDVTAPRPLAAPATPASRAAARPAESAPAAPAAAETVAAPVPAAPQPAAALAVREAPEPETDKTEQSGKEAATPRQAQDESAPDPKTAGHEQSRDTAAPSVSAAKPGPGAPVGVIVGTVAVMIALSVVAVAIYLKT